MLLAKTFWCRYRCSRCGQLFVLPLDDAPLPRHAPRRTTGEGCPADDASPA